MPAHRKPIANLSLSGAVAHAPKRYADRGIEPIPTQGIGCPPSHFDEPLAAIWHELVGIAAPGTLFNSDRLTVELAVRMIHAFRNGELTTASQQSGYLSVLSALGLTPQARTKINVPTPKSESNSPWEKLLQ
jgi:hypothetical protein